MARPRRQPEPEPESLDSNLDNLANAVMAVASQPRSLSVEPAKPDANDTGVLPLQPIKNGFCPNCNDKLRTDLVGNPFCPRKLSNCPRNPN